MYETIMVETKNTYLIPPEAKGKIPLLNNLLEFKSNKYDFFEKNCREMGPLFTFQIFSRKFYNFNHPDFVKHVLVDNAKNYSRKKTYAIFDDILGVGLITAEGEEWRKRRRIVQPAFSKEKLQLLIGDIESTIDKYWTAFDSGSATKLDLEGAMNHLALDMLSSSIIQTDLENQFPEIKQNLNNAFKYITTRRFRALKWIDLPTSTKLKGKKSINALKQTMMRIIENRRSSEIEYNDLLSMLLNSKVEGSEEGLTNVELRDELMTLFVAGHETTAVVLTWTFYLLARHPEIQERVFNEIKNKWNGESLDLKEIMDFSYTQMVLQESMRLYPPVWTFGRQTIEAEEIRGYHIPANADVNLPTMFIHRNPAFWEKPDEFYPEHFSSDKIKEQVKYSYFPFGGGQRKCIGEHYAMMELILVLVHTISKYKVRLDSNEDPGMNLSITIKPKKTVWMHFEKRV